MAPPSILPLSMAPPSILPLRHARQASILPPPSSPGNNRGEIQTETSNEAARVEKSKQRTHGELQYGRICPERRRGTSATVGPSRDSRLVEVKHLRDEPGAGNDSGPIADQTVEELEPRPRR